ncbi:MAG: hypothetical protein AAGA46_13080 [Cyanobacteria bacterium P01_F01_bin.13]
MPSQILYEKLELLPPGSLYPVCKITLLKQYLIHQLVQLLTITLRPKIQPYFSHSGPMAFNPNSDNTSLDNYNPVCCYRNRLPYLV